MSKGLSMAKSNMAPSMGKPNAVKIAVIMMRPADGIPAAPTDANKAVKTMNSCFGSVRSKSPVEA